jgi:DNA mismatch repair protein MutL
MPFIRLLSPEVSSRIAAGEVVERPASALKELLENSLDAGARRIAIEIAGTGCRSLRITDDGSGMDREDCEACLKRHATSKIKALEDLESLATFGFRGEALFAIASVSHLKISTSRSGTTEGWRLEARGGEIISSGPAPALPGTTVEVQDLFFNTPARLKFLRSDSFEKGQLVSAIEETALANPMIHFLYKSNGRLKLNFSPIKGPDPIEMARRRIETVLGENLSSSLVEISAQRPGFALRMFVSPTEALSPTRSFQHWFVNRRPISARILQQALYRAYRNQRTADRHPVCVAYLDLPPETFDVNVHPGKREIRFKSERDIFELIFGLVAGAIAKAKTAAPIVAAPVNTVTSVLHSVAGRSYSLKEPFFAFSTRPADSLQAGPLAPLWFTPPYRYLGQIEKTYLIFEAAGGLFILDQHAAAERILFERYLAQITEGTPKTQRLMLPLPVELPASSVAKFLSQKDRLLRLGFEAEPFGKTAIHILSVPSLFEKVKEIKEMVHRLLETIEDPAGAVQDTRREALATVACKAAVKAHDPLSEKEALELLEDLKECRDGSCCPHGRRTILALNREELARRFQRPGAVPL